MKALKIGLGVALGTLLVLAIDQGGVTTNVAIRSAAAGAAAGVILALFYAYQARRARAKD